MDPRAIEADARDNRAVTRSHILDGLQVSRTFIQNTVPFTNFSCKHTLLKSEKLVVNSLFFRL